MEQSENQNLNKDISQPETNIGLDNVEQFAKNVLIRLHSLNKALIMPKEAVNLVNELLKNYQNER